MLITCPECGEKVSDRASVCIHCGYPLQKENIIIDEIKYCPYCGNKNDVNSDFCGYCGKSFVINKNIESNIANINGDVDILDISLLKSKLDDCSDPIKTQQIQLIQQQSQKQQLNVVARCPNCGSTSLSGCKQGFGVGKAIAGAVLLGGAGLLAGGIGANKTIVTCLNCGHRFKL